MTAQMTYYESVSGARVFAAGAFTLAGAIFQPDVTALVENLWRRLSEAEPREASSVDSGRARLSRGSGAAAPS